MPKNPNLKRILNVLPSRNTQNDWSFDHALAAGVATKAAIPASKDLREAWWKINDQKATGACVGWATADGVVRWHMVKANRLGQNELLSPRFIWMAAKETDQFTAAPTSFIEAIGTSLKAALDIACKFGTVPDSTLPFATGKLYAGDQQAFFALAATRKVASYFNLGTNLANWRSWIALHGPILTRLGVVQTWDQAKATQGKQDTYLPNTVRGGHAIALAGYTADRFIVRNSWGTTAWGDKGFGYASNAYAQAAFTEAYGVTL